MTGPKGECNLDLVRRTVWEGEQELVEIQMPDSQAERDTGFVALPPTTLTQGTQYFDPNPYFGRVLYTHGLALDHPVSITRVEYTDDPQSPVGPGGQGPSRWEPLSIVPIWNDRGKADLFYFAESGEGKYCRVVMTIERCARGSFPFAWFAYDRSLSPAREWHGTLVEDKEDKSGTLYRRARYYEPSTGRFTQEDPIGLAGGMNLYGFASGDPVNYGDPFGLWPDLGAITSGIRNWLYHSESGQLTTQLVCSFWCVPRSAEAAEALGRAEGREPLLILGARTPPRLPGRVIARQGEVEVVHNYRSGDHGPAHAHVEGGGPTTRIGPRGYPLSGDPSLTPAQQRIVEQYAKEIRREINRIGRWLQHQKEQ